MKTLKKFMNEKKIYVILIAQYVISDFIYWHKTAISVLIDQ